MIQMRVDKAMMAKRTTELAFKPLDTSVIPEKPAFQTSTPSGSRRGIPLWYVMAHFSESSARTLRLIAQPQ
jgi:hypothetical protein